MFHSLFRQRLACVVACALLVALSLSLALLPKTAHAHSTSASAPTAQDPVWWQGQGTYYNGNPPFQMLLKITVQGGSLSGTLEEQTYNDTIVAVTGTASTNSDGSVAISFTDYAYIQGNSICLNCIYNATYDTTSMYGTWMYPGNTNPDGNFTLANAMKAAHAISWAQSQLGSQNWDGFCEVFVENAYGTSGQYATAQDAYNALHTSTDWSPDIGALVWFVPNNGNGNVGHVGIYLGQDQFISATYNGVQINDMMAWSNNVAAYEGWGNAPPNWPGR